MQGDANNADAYGQWIEAALEPIKEPMARLSEQFAAVCNALSSAARTAETIGRRSPGESSQLRHRQAQRLITLLGPALTGPAHVAQAERVGRAHALVGSDILWVIEAFSLYQQHIHQLLGPLVPASGQVEHVMRVVSRRITCSTWQGKSPACGVSRWRPHWRCPRLTSTCWAPPTWPI
ncbi:MAG: hypothetical protein HIU89_04635 [Proteobacteria bacterium]|nr:hypothetical protein [Pseudomonadota bacterium]